MVRVFQWLFSRIALVYVIVFIFCLTCVDMKTLEMRIKTRHLNDAIPDFSDMIIFSKDQEARKGIDWRPYKDYFQLILDYIPNDMITKQLLGYVDFYSGQEQKAIDLFKNSSAVSGRMLFWSNYNLGVIYYKKGMWPQAAGYLLNAVSANPRLTLLFMENSIVYRQIRASIYFKYSLTDEINEAQGNAYLLLLSSLYHMGQYDKVIEIAKLGLDNQRLSQKGAFYYYAALSYYATGQIEKAFLLFEKSQQLDRDNPDVYYYLADIYQHAGRLQEAQYSLQISYALHQKKDPRFPYGAAINLRFF